MTAFWATRKRAIKKRNNRKKQPVERLLTICKMLIEDLKNQQDEKRGRSWPGSSNKDGWPAMTYSPSRLQIIKSQRATYGASLGSLALSESLSRSLSLLMGFLRDDRNPTCPREKAFGLIQLTFHGSTGEKEKWTKRKAGTGSGAKAQGREGT
ncbi:hypothetical protein MGYG_01113 [Nannizzia gypsea CBS 118893]|uniref:Uncharacterized protein n=1 Tax=Arthroderma gypseum (strain ATCC MYA-4604 / CBS 118893) TaxID=535722 RepID=E5QYV3_ARTGP|nr:hypothetical protein MGYG_01113 [Nannizzia gypsea CBS 118893]EFQ98076.1 hypothetical protein MGYG_01113 [Nannizzia gypsea CBS 118893]